jgi:hypothetical protein
MWLKLLIDTRAGYVSWILGITVSVQYYNSQGYLMITGKVKKGLSIQFRSRPEKKQVRTVN